ncbi:phage tail spike protein [Staphylococcus hominis]|uniref:phage tail spike protein n=1 Tax=Staphylococcus hominis TaxID=1290 RepID=UPI003AD2971D
MKNVGIHVLDFNDNIIDFISQSDGALINAEMSMNVEEKTETFDFTIENTRAEKLRERNRIIAQDNNGTFREFIIIHITDNFDGTTEIECNASYLEDLKTAKPIKPGKFEAHTTTQALLKTLADTGWEVSDDTEYGGNRTTSWTSHTNPFDLIYMLCTTYNMVPSFYIELGAHTVEHRYVSITKPKNLFKGKEITKGKDLTGMTRTIDLSEVKTALLAVGPEKEDGSRIETVITDDEAQEIFGLPNRYIWDVYEPESNDENMTLKRLTTLAKTELNKRNQAAISYEVSSIDIHKYYNDVTVHLRDIVRVKDRDFKPPLYIEAEVIGIKYNWLADESEFTFGNVIEYEETKLREFFNRKLDEITKKLNDSISNVNTIVSDVVAGELEYYERKIFKGAEPPENPQNDTLWYDTSNPDVAVLRRYWNGKWITQTADDVEKIGGLRREQVMYRDLNNSFINLTIQHSKLQNDVYDVLNSEYLVDDDLKSNLNQALLDVDGVYQEIKTNLDSMDEDTATIGKLVDTQTLFTVYREKLQTLYKYVTDAKISIDKRLKLLQSQYTDEKFNDAMGKIAQSLPNGRWDSENQQLYADIPNRNEVENLKTTLQEYTDGQISNLNSVLGKEMDSKINTTKNEISASISSVERKIDGIEVGGRNLIRNSEKITDYIILASVEKAGTYSLGFEPHFTENIPSEFGLYYGGNIVTLANDKPRITHTFEVGEDRIGKDIRLFFGGTYLTHKNLVNNGYVGKVKLEYGNFATDWTPAPEDIEDEILNSKKEAEEATKAYADAQDELKQTEIQAYADGIVSDEEKRAIADAIAKRDEAKLYAEQKAQEAQEAANQNTSNQLEPIKTRVTTNEASITELDKQISLMAKSDDVAQKLRDVDGRLTPLETTVKSNKATLDILPTQIESKVSKQDYTTDQNNIVQRLDNADSERKQLSNEITDKVTITKFESGITEAKNYTDAYKRSNDVAMTKLETSITQNGDKIALKVDEQKFNASRKTLSQVISEISATTKGINLSYDENGNIQSYTMDKNGIQLRGDKVDITVNKDFNVMASKVDDKVGKNEIINRLNLSPEGLDINVNNIGIRGGDSVDYLNIRNNSILSYGSFTRTWANETDTANLRLGIQGGTVKVQNRTTGYNLYLTEKGLSTMLAGAGDETAGTLEFHSTKYNDRSRGVRLHSTYGAVALESDYSRIILNANLTVNIESNYGIYFRPYRDSRTGNNEFAMYVKQNDSGAYTDGVLKYGNVSSDTSEYGSGLRFSKSSINSTIYATNKDGDIGTGDFFADKLYGDLTAKGSNGYILVDDALRITNKKGYNNGNVNYKDLQCLDVQANSIRVNTARDFYIGVSTGELRVTNNLRYNGGDTGYKDIRFANWHAMSSEKFKYDIKEWNYSVLDAFRNDLRLYSYKLNSEKETNYARNHHGIIIEREIPIEWRHGDGFDGNEVMFWNTKAIQELIKKVDKLEEQLNEQSITS